MMRGITRSLVLGLAAEEGLPVRELDFTLAQVYGADEAFVTGGRAVYTARRGEICQVRDPRLSVLRPAPPSQHGLGASRN
jgi:branched-subunit amino acid aminotransferase/4-amino-4-deoxychorismate lyase